MLRPSDRWFSLLFAAWIALLAGCGTTQVKDPYLTLGDPQALPDSHRKAMEMLDAAPDDPKYAESLQDIMWKPGFIVDIREEAFVRLEHRDVQALKLDIRRNMPNCRIWGWLTRLCELIAERGWTDLSPALVSSWARGQVSLMVAEDTERPEYKALSKLHGPEEVTDLVFTMFVESRTVAEQGLRGRCWDLLHRLGQRERLIALLSSSEVQPDDSMLLDLQATARDLGMVPRNREEIIWVRTLRKPEYAAFWSQATSAVQALDEPRRAALELRDVPIVVSASLHDAPLLAMSRDELYAQVEQRLRGRKHYVQDSNFEGFAGGSRQRLHEYEETLTWGDLAAILTALRALDVPQVVDHLFNYAERDHKDQSTEYGGVIRLDAKNRFEVLEFIPRFRRHDREFIPSQEMLDAAYIAQFQFHFHVQDYRNDNYAGPGFGDVNTADNLRANMLVFTFINERTLNVDYYRHDRVVVDLGEIVRR